MGDLDAGWGTLTKAQEGRHAWGESFSSQSLFVPLLQRGDGAGVELHTGSRAKRRRREPSGKGGGSLGEGGLARRCRVEADEGIGTKLRGPQAEKFRGSSDMPGGSGAAFGAPDTYRAVSAGVCAAARDMHVRDGAGCEGSRQRRASGEPVRGETHTLGNGQDCQYELREDDR